MARRRALAVLALAGAVSTTASALAGGPRPLSKRCYKPPAVTQLTFRAEDGVILDGAELGGGDVGVVLVHQAGADLCQWLPYATFLARHGIRVLVFDSRGSGDSERPGGRKAFRLDRDVAAAAARLRADGAAKVCVVGASLGADAALAAAVVLKPALSCLVMVPGATTALMRRIARQNGLAAGFAGLDPTAAASKLHVPLLIVVAQKDFDGAFLNASRALLALVPIRDKRMIVAPGYNHGVLLLDPFDHSSSRLKRAILQFVDARTR
jgi:pimeloyl-ACP methyl ester carboxylesterase